MRHSRSASRSNPEASANRHSCLLMLVIYVVLSVVYTLVLRDQVTAYALPLALGLAIFGTLFLASVISVVVWPGEVRWLRAARRGEPPANGAICAVSGRLVGEARPAPISGEPALAWSVDIYTTHSSGAQNSSRKITKIKAMGRVPMALEGAAGRFHLGGLIDLDAVKATGWQAEQVMSAATELRARDVAKPFPQSLAGLSTALDDFATQETEYEKVRFDPTDPVMPDDRVEERLLRPGQEVCAFGVFDRHAATLRGRRTLGVERVQVMPGGPRRVSIQLMRKTLFGLLAMTMLFLLSHGLIGAVIFLK